MDYKYEIRGGYLPEFVKTPLVVDKQRLIESIDALCDMSITAEVYIKRITSQQPIKPDRQKRLPVNSNVVSNWRKKMLDTNEQVRIMEVQIHSPIANFTLLEKMKYLTDFFGNDPIFSKEAANIVRSNICKQFNSNDM